MKNTLKLTIFLGLIAALCTGILAGVDMLTKDRIAEQSAGAETAALKELYPDATSFTVIEDFEADSEGLVLAAYQVDDTAYAFRVSSQGFASPVVFLIGFDNDGSNSKYTVLEQNDTAGIGDRILADDYVSDMSGLSTTDSFPLISGATKTSEAVVKGVSAAVEVFNSITGSTGGPAVEEPEEDPVALLSESEGETSVTYEVESKGFAGNNVFEITVDTTEHTIVSVVSKVYSDTPGPDYGEKVITEENLASYEGLVISEANVDVVSGATFTSNSLQAAVDLVKELYSERPDENTAVIEVEAPGYNPDTPNIIAVHINKETNTVSAVKVVEFNDTKGLGDQATTEERLNEYVGLTIDDEVNVDVVSGATVTSKAVDKAVVEALAIHAEGGQ